MSTKKNDDMCLIHPKPAQFSILHATAITGDKEMLQKLLKSSYLDIKDNIDNRDKYGRTPIIFSVLGNNYECTDLLLKVSKLMLECMHLDKDLHFGKKAGANPGLKDKAGRNALHWAAHHGHVKCLKSLLNSKSARQMMLEKDNVND